MRIRALNIELNFYAVAFPAGQLPFQMRELAATETLRENEFGWRQRGAERGSRPTHAILTTYADGKADGYEVAHLHLDDVNPRIVERLLREGLARTLRSGGRLVIERKLSVSCFKPNEMFTDSVPPFLSVRRGVEFRDDYVSTITPRRTLGFFVSTDVRLELKIGLQDPVLAQVVLGHRVRPANDGGGAAFKVVAAPVGGQVQIERDGERRDVATDDLSVIPTPALLRTYCEAIGEPQLPSHIKRLEQMASYRWTRSGQRNRRWIAEQSAQVRTWLDSIAPSSRLQFDWPNSEHQVFLSTRPLPMVESPLS